MKFFTLTFSFILILFLHAAGQEERRVSGQLKDDTGQPLPGVNIVIKGTSRGTVTDDDGRYEISAPIGSILVFSFVGMTTREAVVTKNGLSTVLRRIPATMVESRPFALSWIEDGAPDTTGTSGRGVGVLGPNTGRILNPSDVKAEEILKVRRFGRNYWLHTIYPGGSVKPNFGIQFASSIDVERINRMPALQSTFAQGRSAGNGLQWQGAEAGERFSFGPLLRTLEFDGTSYPYDRNGKLVPLGMGSGNLARAYNPLDFFNDVIGFNQELSVNSKLRGNSYASASFERSDRSGAIPGSQFNKNNLSLRLKSFPLGKKFSLSASTWYQFGNGRLMSHGSNLTSIVHSVYTTPPSFDNSNGIGKWDQNHTGRWLLPDGTVRSYAGSAADNPYDLAANLPDRDRHARWLSGTQLEWSGRYWSVRQSMNYDRQASHLVNGSLPGTLSSSEGRLTERSLNTSLLTHVASVQYTPDPGAGWSTKWLVALHSGVHSIDLNRTDRFGFTRDNFAREDGGQRRVSATAAMRRSSQELAMNASARYREYLFLKAGNRAYFSNTLARRFDHNLMPFASLEIDIARWVNDETPVYLGWLERTSVYVNYARNIREAPLLWSDWAYGSAVLPAEQGMRFYESTEVLFNGVSPEIENRWETGMILNSFPGVQVYANYSRSRTQGLVVPVYRGASPELRNAADIKTDNLRISASKSFSLNYYRNLQVELFWHKYNPMVEEVYGPDEVVVLSGFADVSSVIAKGKPLGAIYGSSYARNSEGALLIDSDGFPLVDRQLRMIGNPIPKWSAGATINFTAKEWRVWTVWNLRHGGDRWNGTARVLDYYGRSESSASERTINNFVFDGVTVQGNPNVKPVAFADPGTPTTSNRWVRDGYVGAAEEYVREASWVRMSELGVSWTRARTTIPLIKSFSVALVARNLLLLTRYDGVDPSTTLFGYSNGHALDFFNMPNTNGWSMTVSAKF